MSRSLTFFMDKLGFRVEFRMGDPMECAIIERDIVSLHLTSASRDTSAFGQARIYNFAAGVDALHGELLPHIRRGSEDTEVNRVRRKARLNAREAR